MSEYADQSKQPVKKMRVVERPDLSLTVYHTEKPRTPAMDVKDLPWYLSVLLIRTRDKEYSQKIHHVFDSP